MFIVFNQALCHHKNIEFFLPVIALNLLSYQAGTDLNFILKYSSSLASFVATSTYADNNLKKTKKFIHIKFNNFRFW